KSLKTKVSITLDTDLIEVLKELAEQDDRSFSQYINLALKEYVKNQSTKKDE
ncbi:ribbon-helix-helix protein, CopG family, partial [Soehngenia saccharolytica]